MRRASLTSRGFTLIEVTVALAIAGLCLTAIFKALTFATRTAGITQDYYRAAQIGESRMALLLASEIKEGSRKGEIDERFYWEATVYPYEVATDDELLGESPLANVNHRLAAYHYSVRVSWGETSERDVEFSTIRLGLQQ